MHEARLEIDVDEFVGKFSTELMEVGACCVYSIYIYIYLVGLDIYSREIMDVGDMIYIQ